MSDQSMSCKNNLVRTIKASLQVSDATFRPALILLFAVAVYMSTYRLLEKHYTNMVGYVKWSQTDRDLAGSTGARRRCTSQ